VDTYRGSHVHASSRTRAPPAAGPGFDPHFVWNARKHFGIRTPDASLTATSP